MSQAPPRRRRPSPALCPDDWADAGLHVIARQGWAALTVDSVAAWLRVTKGSFYWHFKNREAFLRAVLARWRFMSSTGTLARVADVADPRLRLRRVLELVIEETGPIELDTAIWSARFEPLVAEAMDAASRERLTLLTNIYRELGYTQAHARRWALAAYSAFVGLISTGTAARDLLGSPTERKAYARHIAELFVPPAVGVEK